MIICKIQVEDSVSRIAGIFISGNRQVWGGVVLMGCGKCGIETVGKIPFDCFSFLHKGRANIIS